MVVLASGLGDVHLLYGFWGQEFFFPGTRLLKIANSRNLRLLSLVSALQEDKYPKHLPGLHVNPFV